MRAAVVLADRAAVDALRQGLARQRRLIEPGRTGGSIDWGRSTAEAPFDWDRPPTLPSVKRFFFPAREPLLRWQGDDASALRPRPLPFVLFGVRPCDVNATRYLDRFFSRDGWYQSRRSQALLVAVNCQAACAGGFCADVDAGPFLDEGADITLTLLGDGRIIVEFGSPAGHDAVAATAVKAEPCDARTRAAYEHAAAAARASFPERSFVARGARRLNGGEIADREWQALGPSCFACSGCSNVCPTCSCFTVVDAGTPASGERARHWDSCLLEGFQREASGHHPAPRAADRVRRYWEHKFSAAFVPACGRIGCVGCGRCDVACLGNIGALRVLEALGRDPCPTK